MNAENHAIFYVKGYEKQAHATKESLEMTPEVRKDASDFIKADNNLRYEAAKAEYEHRIQGYDTTEIKGEKINLFQYPLKMILS